MEVRNWRHTSWNTVLSIYRWTSSVCLKKIPQFELRAYINHLHLRHTPLHYWRNSPRVGLARQRLMRTGTGSRCRPRHLFAILTNASSVSWQNAIHALSLETLAGQDLKSTGSSKRRDATRVSGEGTGGDENSSLQLEESGQPFENWPWSDNV